MKPLLLLSTLLLALTLCSNCTQSGDRANKKTGQKSKVDFFDPIQLDRNNSASNFSIEAQFSDCGEWGGHKEKITLYADSEMNIHARYRVYPYNCDSILFYYFNRDLNPILDKEKLIGEKEKQSINDYIQSLVQAKISERFPGHAADIFSVTNADSTLYIHVRDSKEANVNSFKKLVNDLFN